MRVTCMYLNGCSFKMSQCVSFEHLSSELFMTLAFDAYTTNYCSTLYMVVWW